MDDVAFSSREFCCYYYYYYYKYLSKSVSPNADEAIECKLANVLIVIMKFQRDLSTFLLIEAHLTTSQPDGWDYMRLSM